MDEKCLEKKPADEFSGLFRYTPFCALMGIRKKSWLQTPSFLSSTTRRSGI